MGSKGHFLLSVIKSIFRIWGCIMAYCSSNWYVLAGTFFLAELLGLTEEFVDERGMDNEV